METFDIKFDYVHIFFDLEKYLKGVFLENKIDTTSMTREIISFFKSRFESTEFATHYADSKNNKSEFLYDFSVTTSNTENLKERTGKLLLAMESELGGSGASSSKYVVRNALQDFSKLLQSKAKYRIMIAIYDNDILKEYDIFKNEYLQQEEHSPILLILIKGNHSKEKHRQIQVSSPLNLSNFILAN